MSLSITPKKEHTDRDAYTGGIWGAAAPPAAFQGLNYFSAKMYMVRPQ